jgi:hypothetical protein
MPTIEVDLGFFLAVTIIGLFGLPFIIGWTFWKGYKNPEFWLRLKRQDFVYVLIWNGVGKLVQIVLPLSKIGDAGEFRIFKNRKYFWRTKDPKNGIVTVFPWKKKMGALYDWMDPYPQVKIPGNSLTSTTDPGMLDDMGEMKILKMMMNADSMTRLMRLALVISVIGIIGLGGVAFAVYTQSASVDHLSCILKAGSNATIAAACH